MFRWLDTEVAACKTHLIVSGTQGTQIEAILAGYIISVAYAKLEEAVRNSLLDRCKAGMDPLSERFLEKAIARMVQSIRISELSGILGSFSTSVKEQFQQDMKRDKGQTATYYDNLVSNRHALVHQASANATMKDIDEWLPSAKKVIESFRKALGLRPGQT